jgi:hypothetical protein
MGALERENDFRLRTVHAYNLSVLCGFVVSGIGQSAVRTAAISFSTRARYSGKPTSVTKSIWKWDASSRVTRLIFSSRFFLTHPSKSGSNDGRQSLSMEADSCLGSLTIDFGFKRDAILQVGHLIYNELTPVGNNKHLAQE